MKDSCTLSATAAMLGLQAQGFSPREAARLVRLKLRWARGQIREFTAEQKRLLFIRWLVQQGRLTDGEDALAFDSEAHAA
jgi:hypothetical protein